MPGSARLRGTVGAPAVLSQTVTVSSADVNKTHVVRFSARVIQTRVLNPVFDEGIQFWADGSVGAGRISWDSSRPALRMEGPDANNRASADQRVSVHARYCRMRHTIKVKVEVPATKSVQFHIGSFLGGADILGVQNLTGDHQFTFVPNRQRIYLRFSYAGGTGADAAFVSVCYLVNHERIEIAGALQGVGGEVRIETGGGGLLASRWIADGTHTISFMPKAAGGVVIKFLTEAELWVDDVAFVVGPLELSSDYVSDNVPRIQWTQSADVMYLVHPKHPPRKLMRFRDLDWSLAVFDAARNPFAEGWDNPSAVAFFDQRLFFGGSILKPQTLWGSRINDFENFTLGTADDDAMEVTLSTGRGNRIVTMVPSGDRLFIGTSGSEHLLSGSQQKAVGPKNLNLKRTTNYGSEIYSSSLVIGTNVIFVERGGLRLRAVVFEFETDSFEAQDLSILADHLVEDAQENPRRDGLKSIAEIAPHPAPHSLIWVRRKDGKLLSLTFERRNQIVAWATYRLGGTFGTGKPPVMSLAVIPHSSRTGYVLWLIVRRTIGGVSKSYIEFLGEHEGSYYRSLLVDSALVGTFANPVSSVGGLDHLEGQQVRAIGDGHISVLQTVTGGQVSLDPPARDVEVGLPFETVLETLPVDALAAGDETTAGLIRSRPRLFLAVRNTQGIVLNGQTDIPLRRASDDVALPPPLFSGLVEVANIGADREDSVIVSQELPRPLEILALIGKVVYGER